MLVKCTNKAHAEEIVIVTHLFVVLLSSLSFSDKTRNAINHENKQVLWAVRLAFKNNNSAYYQ